MRVRYMTCSAGHGFVRNVGDEVDLPDAEAGRLIAAGIAKRIREEPPATPPKPSPPPAVKAPETAVDPAGAPPSDAVDPAAKAPPAQKQKPPKAKSKGK